MGKTRRAWIRKTLFMSFLLSVFMNIPVYARENAYIATFFDDANLKWAPTVMCTSEEIEKKYITASCFGTNVLEFIQTPNDYTNFGVEYKIDDSRTSVVKFANNKGEFSTIWKKDSTLTRFPHQLYDEKKNDKSYISKTYSAPLTFPPAVNDANASDINRAFVVCQNLGDGLNGALKFLNDGQSFTETSDQTDYFQHLTYLLLSAGSTTGSHKIVNNETGKIYGICYGKKPDAKATINDLHNIAGGDNYCYIKCYGKIGSYDDNTVGSNEGETGWYKFMYRMHKGYYYDGIVDTKSSQTLLSTRSEMSDMVKSSTDTIAVLDKSKDIDKLDKYIQGFTGGGKDAVTSPFIDTTQLKSTDCYYFNDKGDDGSINPLEHSVLYAGDTEYINWFQMVIEAQMFKSMQVTYSNQDDLISATESDSAAVSFVRKQLNSLRTALGLNNLEQLIFNQGIRGSKAYVDGMYPSSWEDNIMYLFIICVIIAVSLITISVAKAAIECNIASALPSVKMSMMGKIQDVLVAVALIAFALPVIYMATELSSDLVNVFSNSAITGKFKSLESMASNNLISGIVIQFAYFIICIYANWTYIIRGIVLAILTASTPLFIIGIAFGNRGKDLAKSWLVEFVGNLLLQPVHAMIIAFLMSVNTGLTGMESIVFMACIIPVTNMLKSIISKGGGMASTLGAQLTGGSVGLGAAAVSGAITGAGEAAGAMANGLEGKSWGRTGFAPGSMTMEGAAMGSRTQTAELNKNRFGMAPFSDRTRSRIEEGINSVGSSIEFPNSKIFKGGSSTISRIDNAIGGPSGMLGGSARIARGVTHTTARALQHGSFIAKGASGVANMGLGAGMMTAMAGTGSKEGGQLFNTGINDAVSGVKEVSNITGHIGNKLTEGISGVTANPGIEREYKKVGKAVDKHKRDSNGQNVVYMKPAANGTAVGYTMKNAKDLTSVSISKDKASVRYQFKPDKDSSTLDTKLLYKAYSLTQSSDKEDRAKGYRAIKQRGFTKLEMAGGENNHLIAYAPNRFQLEKVKLVKGEKGGTDKIVGLSAKSMNEVRD